MNQESAISKEIKELIGIENEPVIWEVDGQWLKKFAQAIDDPNPLYQDEIYARNTTYGTLIAPPTFPTALRNENLKKKLEKIDHPMKRKLNGGSEIEWFEPIRKGDIIRSTVKLADVKETETKLGNTLFFVFETTFTNQLGQIVAVIRNNSIWY